MSLTNLFSGIGPAGAGYPVTTRGIGREKYRDGAIGGRAMHASRFDGSFYYDDCSEIVEVRASATSYGDPTGATGNVNRVFLRSGLFADIHVKGTQTLLAPLRDDTHGIDISQDQTDNDGVEWIFGGNQANNKLAVVTGTTETSFLMVRARIADVSGTDDFCIGWRKVETNQANVDDYTEAAHINVNLGSLLQETIVANAATTSSPSALASWLDGETHTVYVEINGAGKLTVLFDGARFPVRPTAFTFAAGITLVPYVFFLQATTSPGKVFFKELAMGRNSFLSNAA